MIKTLGLLAGAYKGKRASLQVTLTHSFDVDGNWETTTTLCGSIKGESVCDEGAYSDEQMAAAPTCQRCLKKDPRFGGKA